MGFSAGTLLPSRLSCELFSRMRDSCRSVSRDISGMLFFLCIALILLDISNTLLRAKKSVIDECDNSRYICRDAIDRVLYASSKEPIKCRNSKFGGRERKTARRCWLFAVRPGNGEIISLMSGMIGCTMSKAPYLLPRWTS